MFQHQKDSERKSLNNKPILYINISIIDYFIFTFSVNYGMEDESLLAF